MTKKFLGVALSSITRLPVDRLIRINTIDSAESGPSAKDGQFEIRTELKFRKGLEKYKGELAENPAIKSLFEQAARFCDLEPLTCFILACPEGDEVVGETVVGRVFMKSSRSKALMVPTGQEVKLINTLMVYPISSRIELQFCQLQATDCN